MYESPPKAAPSPEWFPGCGYDVSRSMLQLGIARPIASHLATSRRAKAFTSQSVRALEARAPFSVPLNPRNALFHGHDDIGIHAAPHGHDLGSIPGNRKRRYRHPPVAIDVARLRIRPYP